MLKPIAVYPISTGVDIIVTEHRNSPRYGIWRRWENAKSPDGYQYSDIAAHVDRNLALTIADTIAQRMIAAIVQDI